jgi:hypothetical protein
MLYGFLGNCHSWFDQESIMGVYPRLREDDIYKIPLLNLALAKNQKIINTFF